MIPPVNHRSIEAESYIAPPKAGAAGRIQLRPVAGQPLPRSLAIEGNKSLVNDYPPGTRFKIQVALTDRPGRGGQYLFTSWQWDVIVLALPETEPEPATGH